MNARTFFKLYSFPVLIVVLGIGVYAGVIVLMEQQEVIVTKRNQNIQHNNRQDNQALARIEGNSLIDSSVESTQKPQKDSQPSDNAQAGTHTQQLAEAAQATPTPNPPAISDPVATSPASPSKQVYGYAKYRINIRQYPSAESAIVSRAAIGEALEILEAQQEWSKVRSRFGVEGYVASRLLAQNPSNGEAYVVVANALNVRALPDSSGAVIGRLNYDTRVYVLEIQDEWAKIQLPNKQYGYISLKHILKSAN